MTLAVDYWLTTGDLQSMMEGMTSTTVERHGADLTIHVRIPVAPTHPLPIPPLGEAVNTAAAVASLYAW